jgi:hypothetical protein
MKKRRVDREKLTMMLEPISDDEVPVYSRCCGAEITGRRLSTSEPLVTVLVGLCTKCKAKVARRNPRTGQHEWLNGLDYATTENAKM